MKYSKQEEQSAEVVVSNIRHCKEDIRRSVTEKNYFLRQLLEMSFFDKSKKESNDIKQQLQTLLAEWDDEKDHVDIGVTLLEMLQKRNSTDDLPYPWIPFEGTKAPVFACWSENHDSSLACHKFRSLFSDTKEVSHSGFQSVAESVGEGEADFGILPIETSENGMLYGFYRMIEKWDLYICAVCDIENSDNESMTRFALVSSKPYCLDGNREMYFEILESNPSGVRNSESTALTDRLGLKIQSENSLPGMYNSSTYLNYTVLSGLKDSIFNYLSFLWLFDRDYSFLGVFLRVS